MTGEGKRMTTKWIILTPMTGSYSGKAMLYQRGAFDTEQAAFDEAVELTSPDKFLGDPAEESVAMVFKVETELVKTFHATPEPEIDELVPLGTG